MHVLLGVLARGGARSSLHGSLLVVTRMAALGVAVPGARAAGRAASAGASVSAAAAGVLCCVAVVLASVALLLVHCLDADHGGVAVALELGIIQALDGVFHVVAVRELHDALTVSLDVGEHHVASLTHEVLQVLPAAAAWQVRHDYTVVGSLATSAARSIATTVVSTTSAVALGELDTKAVAIEVVAVAAANSVLGIPVVIESNECESRRASWRLQVNLTDLSVSIIAHMEENWRRERTLHCMHQRE